MPPRFSSIAPFLSFAFAFAIASTRSPAAETATSAWAHPGADGRLHYQTTPTGDRIMDFSHAGYEGGGVALPDVPVKETVRPSPAGDDTAAIQAAIDRVAALPLQNGFRGAVLLAPGVFTSTGPLTLATSGIVLRGSGSATGGTTLKMAGPRHAAFVIGARRPAPVRARTPSEEDDDVASTETNASGTGKPTTIGDAYVPEGAVSFSVVDIGNFAVGDTIAIRRPTTAAWVEFMQMHNLQRDGRAQTWIAQNRSGVSERKITAISGHTLTLDQPLADSYDAKYLNPPGTSVTKIGSATAVSHVGVEFMRVQCPPLEIAYGRAPYSCVRVGGDDCWVRDVVCDETMNTTTLAGKRITMERVVVTHTFPNLGASKPTDFSLEGTQVLIDRCSVTGDNTYFVWTAALFPGPNVLLNCTFRGHGSRIQPHMRWSTGLLVDNCTVPDGGIDFMNRGVAGSGHGWTMGWAVAWNCVAKTYVIQNPPGAMNWAIGCIGQREQTARMFDRTPILPEGTFESHGTPVAPSSLYLAQLAERLGPVALKTIGYASNTPGEFPNKQVPPLPALRTDDDPVLGPDLALHRPVNTSDVRRGGQGGAREFGGERALDADEKTYWATNDGVGRSTFEVDMEGPVEINAVVLEEPLATRGQIRSYKIEGQVDSDWKQLAEGSVLGERAVHRFPNVVVWKVRLTVLKAEPFAAIRKFGIYRAAQTAVVSPSVR